MEIKKVPCKGLSTEEYDKALKVDWQPELAYAWDNGIGIGAYLAALKEGKILAAKCDGCGRIMLPARAFCELCFRPTDGYVAVHDTGVVNTFAVSHVNWDASRLKEKDPRHLPAVIEIDGASKGQGILHILGNVKPGDVKIGMKVRAVWKPAGERTGSITDILFFEPVK
ncbi:MAG: Zn-ribbon domain-containing OB-fold protein [Candidatus Eisenbacteria bacterium]|nr:Zn-ribbon domain-containing OB-fold protein [Candidatus Eisenbacteria bacterium]